MYSVERLLQVSRKSRIILSFGDELLKMCVFIVSSGLYSGFCERNEKPLSLFITIVPSSGFKTPAIVFKSVDFPEPFLPINAAFSPSFKPKVTELNKSSSRPIFLRLFMERMFIFSPCILRLPMLRQLSLRFYFLGVRLSLRIYLFR